MKGFVPREKLGKKRRKSLDGQERKKWDGLNPATKILESKKLYSRKKTRTRNDEYGPGF